MSVVVKFTRDKPLPPSQNAAVPRPRSARATWQMMSPLQKRAALLFGGALTVVTGIALVAGVRSRSWAHTDYAMTERHVFPVNSRVPGYIKEIYKKEGDAVVPGEVLLAFDDTDLQIELKLKRAKLEKVQRDHQRAKMLSLNQAISRADLETAEAALAFSKAELEATELKQQFLRVAAPAAGTVARVHAHVGQVFQPGQSLMTVVEPADALTVRAHFKETDLRTMAPGDLAEVTVDAFPSQTFAGRVLAISPTSASALNLIPSESASGHFTRVAQRVPVRIELIQKPPPTLLGGLSARVRIRLSSGVSAHAAP